MNFIHLTDLHLSHPDLDDPGLHSDTVANLRLAVTQLRRMSPAPAFIVVSGDLTNHGDRASYELVRDILADLDMPIVHALGNHDVRAGFRAVFRAVFPDDGGGNAEDAPYCHHRNINGLEIITLDTSVPGRVGGAICDEQFAFLAQALGDTPDAPKLLVLHHPPLIDKTALVWESLPEDDSTRLAEMVRPHNIIGMLCGHVHVNRVSFWHGIPVIVNCGLHATFDALAKTGLRAIEGTGFASCTWRPSGLTVTFIPLTPERRVLGEYPDDLIRSFR